MSKNNSISLSTLTLIIYFLLMPFDIILLPGIGSVVKIWGIVVLFTYLFSIKFVKVDRQIFWIFLFLFYCIFSLIYSPSVQTSTSELTSILLNYALVFVVCSFKEYNDKEKKLLFNSIVISGIFMVALTLLFPSYDITGRLSIKIGDSTQDENYINGYILFTYIAIIYSLFFKKKKIIPLILLFALIAFTIMTGSRGALIAELVMLVIFIFISIKNMKNPRLKLLSIISLSVIMLVLVLFYENILSLFPPEVAKRFTFNYIQENGATNRENLWLKTWNAYCSGNLFNWLFGFGIGTVKLYTGGKVTHNVFLQFLLELGIIGLLIFILLLISFLRCALKSKNYMMFTLLIGYIIMMMSLSITTYKPIYNCFIIISIMAQGTQKNVKKLVF